MTTTTRDTLTGDPKGDALELALLGQEKIDRQIKCVDRGERFTLANSPRLPATVLAQLKQAYNDFTPCEDDYMGEAQLVNHNMRLAESCSVLAHLHLAEGHAEQAASLRQTGIEAYGEAARIIDATRGYNDDGDGEMQAIRIGAANLLAANGDADRALEARVHWLATRGTCCSTRLDRDNYLSNLAEVLARTAAHLFGQAREEGLQGLLDTVAFNLKAEREKTPLRPLTDALACIEGWMEAHPDFTG